MKNNLLLTIAFLLTVSMNAIGQTNINDGRSSNFTAFDVKPIVKNFTHLIFVSDKDYPTKDQIIADDLIVTANLGVGADCVNGEAFGFNSILLKENNNRIRFEDTSIPPFPANDWTLIANETSSGGADYFAIEDGTAGLIPFKIMAGAPTNSLFVSSAGRLGIGTPNPSLQLQVTYGNTPSQRFEQDASQGWSVQTWDIAGNEANFFIRDITHGSTLPFRIQPGAPTSTLSIMSTGNVGIGTWSPTQKLDINGSMKLTALLTAPTGPTEGVIYMDGNDHLIKYYDGTEWKSIADQQKVSDLEARIVALENALGLKSVGVDLTKISQNAPNPFKFETNIMFNIPNEVADASLIIYNVNGEIVKEISIYDRGNGNLNINGNNITTGTYFYTLILDGKKVDSKIMIKVD